jgi:hypothetical protein
MVMNFLGISTDEKVITVTKSIIVMKRNLSKYTKLKKPIISAKTVSTRLSPRPFLTFFDDRQFSAIRKSTTA